MNRFIQLMHPGCEPNIIRSRSTFCPPNQGIVHKRKFLQSYGKYLDKQSIPQCAKLNFWGEWELASHVQRIVGKPSLGMPLYLHTPVCPQKALTGEIQKSINCTGINDPCCQSTDPFVFCEPFLYFHCQIRPNSQLDNLTRGDIVVFGSHLAGHFVLDTVFVVAERVKLDDPKVCQKFLVVNQPFLNQFPGQVYLGATFTHPVDGMFSFFPALPTFGNIPQPFSRPILGPTLNLKLQNLINPALMMHHKISKINNSFDVWQSIVLQVTTAGLFCGLKA